MAGLGFGLAAAGGGMVDKLQQMLEFEFIKQKERERLAEEIRQADQRHGIAQGGLQQGQQRIDLDTKKLDEDTRQFGVTSGQSQQRIDLDKEIQPVRIANLKAQTGEIERKPLAEEEAHAREVFLTNLGGDIRSRHIKEGGLQDQATARIRTRPRISKTQGKNAAGETVTKFIDIDTQEVVHEEPVGETTGERDRKAASGRAGSVLSAISELSERINTGQGVLAKISGGVERQKAQLNLNDDLSEYEAVVSGFTPLLARAVGHTGVLTEQDVQSVRKMLPQPGDSKSVRDRKITRINSLMGVLSGADTPQTTPAGGSKIKSITEIK